MVWQQIFSGILLVVRSEFAIMQFHHIELTPLTAFLITAIWTNLKVVLIFTSTSLADWLVLKLGKRHLHLNEMIAEQNWITRLNQSMKNGKKRFLAWLLKHNKMVIYLIIFMPFTPFMEDVAIVAARIARIKKALPFLMIANTLRMALVTWLVYFVF
ncbi:hypothetical protein KKG58_01460 [Patescibacteria group bacterium]|nr:hypothetical protein [Patescibacteria group bacterium]